MLFLYIIKWASAGRRVDPTNKLDIRIKRINNIFSCLGKRCRYVVPARTVSKKPWIGHDLSRQSGLNVVQTGLLM